MTDPHAPTEGADTVSLSLAEFEALREYSCSLPTGTTIGKRWKRREPYNTTEVVKRWLMGEYVECPEPGRVGIVWRQITSVT